MFKVAKQRERDLFESERSFRLLVEGVADYALYMLDPDRDRDQLEYRRAAHQGLFARGNRRPAFLPLLHRDRPRQRQARARPAHRGGTRPL